MKRKFISSSNLKSIGYDDSSNTMEVEFHNGNVYKYLDVPRQAYERFVNNPDNDSHGQHFHNNIKNAYKYLKS